MPPPPRRRIAKIPRWSPPRPPPQVPQIPPVTFNAPLYTLKAFTIATAVVLTTATASVAGVMNYLDVRNTEEFATRMRTWVSQSMPLLNAKIYRQPTSRDSLPGDPILIAAQIPQRSLPFDHDASQQRLAEAFDQGGLDAWAEAAAEEMEAEIQVERSKKNTTYVERPGPMKI